MCQIYWQTQWFGAFVVCHACSFTLCKYMKRSLAMAKLWITRIVFCMQIYETWFGHGLIMEYEKCLFVAGLRSIQCIIIARVLVCARD